MQNPFAPIYSPLKKDNCTFFLGLTVLSFVLLIGFILAIIKNIIWGGHKNPTEILSLIASIPPLVISYYESRLLYSMCISSLQ